MRSQQEGNHSLQLLMEDCDVDGGTRDEQRLLLVCPAGVSLGFSRAGCSFFKTRRRSSHDLGRYAEGEACEGNWSGLLMNWADGMRKLEWILGLLHWIGPLVEWLEWVLWMRGIGPKGEADCLCPNPPT
ncbi:hypothetical protein Droror1_Dr00020429, partial [Drosera rotundifolia]